MIVRGDGLKGDGDEFGGALEGAGCLFRDAPEELRRAAAHVPVKGADGAFQRDFVADDVELFPAADGPDGHHEGTEGIVETGDDGLEIQQDGARRDDGVPAEVGRGAVGGYPADDAAEIGARREERPRAEAEFSFFNVR